MSWIQEQIKLSWFQRLALNVVKSGPIPQHVAFIMDGNRRFATKANMKKSEGHSKGFDKLSETLQWCFDVGIREVTVYAFSIENFKRSQEEVDTLMRLAREKFAKLLEERDKLHEKGVCIKIIGNLSLLSDDLKKTIAEAMLLTKDNDRATLNVAFAYTSRDEITHSIKTVVKGVQDDDINCNDISEDLLTECLYTKSSAPQLLVRTSGETRLSDFLLWQANTSIIYFTNTLWPEFTFWHLLGAVFYYQRCYFQLHHVKSYFQRDNKCITDNHRVNTFLNKIDNQRHEEMLQLVNS